MVYKIIWSPSALEELGQIVRYIRRDKPEAALRLGTSSSKTYEGVMTPEAALEAQIERYRQMSGEQRLEIALRLHELSCNVAREGIRAQFPGSSEEEVEQRLKERLRLAYEV
jgi:plasmid stabilization system protein ParE